MNNANITLLDIPFTSLYEKEIFGIIKENFSKKIPAQIFLATPNPEMLLASQNNKLFRKTLQSTDINIPDGNGLIWANIFLKSTTNNSFAPLIVLKGIFSLIYFIFHKKNKKIRFNKAIHGSDFTKKVCLDKDLCRHGIFLLGNKNSFKPETTRHAKENLEKQNPDLKISGYYDSTPTEDSVIEKINQSQAQIIFVAFGAPHQELWIKNNLKKLPNIKLAVGIGGSFDFIAGTIPRAPKWMRKLGFEWLFRLLLEPKRRVKRILNATIVFPYKIIKDRLANPHKHKISDI